MLEQLPFIMRKIIETIVTKPYVYQWLDRTEMEIHLGESSIKSDGWIFQELSLLSNES